MAEGDLLLLLTDGFHEWQRSGDNQLFGADRLEQTLAAHAQREPREILKSLDAAVRTFANGSPQTDDMTAVIIKRTAPKPAPTASSSDERQLLSVG
jgi:sigma-B regulation protein RsbU (phosphoserine phosphatase)